MCLQADKMLTFAQIWTLTRQVILSGLCLILLLSRKVLLYVSSGTCMLDPDPFWVIKLAQEKTTGWVHEVISASLRDECSNTSLTTWWYVPYLRSHAWTLPCWIIIRQFPFCSSWKRLVRYSYRKSWRKQIIKTHFRWFQARAQYRDLLVACFELLITSLVINNKKTSVIS